MMETTGAAFNALMEEETKESLIAMLLKAWGETSAALVETEAVRRERDALAEFRDLAREACERADRVEALAAELVEAGEAMRSLNEAGGDPYGEPGRPTLKQWQEAAARARAQGITP